MALDVYLYPGVQDYSVEHVEWGSSSQPYQGPCRTISSKTNQADKVLDIVDVFVVPNPFRKYETMQLFFINTFDYLAVILFP